MSAAPLDDSEAAVLLAPFSEFGPLLIAVSGGPDSTALLGIASAVRRGRGDCAATVDHRLREGSTAEAEAVAGFALRLGLPHAILTWRGEKPASGLQAAAREARYALLAAHAAEIGAGGILLAHTLDDQAETVLMRLMHGSGLRGLGGMRAITRRGDVMLGRPLLSVPKARLVATCEARGWPFVTDPSNSNSAHLRPRLRALMPALAREGLTATRIARFAARAAEADAVVDGAARLRLDQARAAAGTFRAEAFDGAERAILIRMLQVALVEGGAAEPLALERIEALAERLSAAMRGDMPLHATLGGVKLSLAKGVLAVRPAPPRRKVR